jgi:predicted Zn-dependent peptidase
MKLKKTIFQFLSIVMLCAQVYAGSALDNAKTYKLKNGLKVILKENQDMPLVSLQVWVKTGAINEIRELNGISHFIEHMMFKGTKNITAQQIAHEVEAYGGDINAATSDEYTFYSVDIPTKGYEKALEILYEISSQPVFPENELERERLVILEEISRGKDMPRTKLWDAFRPLAYRLTPYQYSVIGSSEVIQSITRDEILNYFYNNYTPETMTVIAAGDFKNGEIIRQIKKLFGSIQSKQPRMDPNLTEPEHAGASKTEEVPVNQIYFMGGFLGPDIDSPDQYALDVLAIIL